MKRIQFFLLMICLATLINAQDTQKVLFIGNSYTGVNNLPSLVNQVAASVAIC